MLKQWIDLTETQHRAFVDVASVLTPPRRGVHVGLGIHIDMPGAITTDDMLSSDTSRTIGWTFFGAEQRGVILVTGGVLSAIKAEDGSKVTDEVALAIAKALVPLAQPVQMGPE